MQIHLLCPYFRIERVNYVVYHEQPCLFWPVCDKGMLNMCDEYKHRTWCISKDFCQFCLFHHFYSSISLSILLFLPKTQPKYKQTLSTYAFGNTWRAQENGPPLCIWHFQMPFREEKKVFDSNLICVFVSKYPFDDKSPLVDIIVWYHVITWNNNDLDTDTCIMKLQR